MPEQTLEKGMNVGDVYAAALLALAQADGTVDATRSELEELVRLAAEDAAFNAFLDSAVIDSDVRAQSLERMFRGRLSDRVLDTLQVLNAHGRAGLLPAVLRCYVLRVEGVRNQVEARVTSAVPLDEGQRAEVTALAERLSGRTPLIEFVVDPQVLGGLVLHIGDWRYDHTVRRHLRDAQDQLLQRLHVGSAA